MVTVTESLTRSKLLNYISISSIGKECSFVDYHERRFYSGVCVTNDGQIDLHKERIFV